MAKCKLCGRNFTGELSIKKYCRICAKMDYAYNQGAITIDDYKKWEKDWIKNFK
jgi:hypothetical protein